MFASREPAELRSYLAVLEADTAYHAGSTVPAIGEVRQLANGLWVPARTQLAPAPIDLMKTYITFHEVFGESATLNELRALLRNYSREDLLGWCGTLVREMEDGGIEERAQHLIAVLQPPYSQRLDAALQGGRPLFSRQSAFVLAKLAIADCPETGNSEALPLAVGIGILSLLAHELLGSRNQPAEDEPGDARIGGMPPRLSMELIANHWFNRSMDEANFLALYERRWIDGGRPSTVRVAGEFEAALGFRVDDLASVALALWAGCRGESRYVIFDLPWLDSLNLPAGRLESVLSLIAIDLDEARAQIMSGEIENGALDWNFDTFERYPLLRLDERRFCILDPALLVRRCLGWAPMYDLAAAKKGSGKAAEHALADASEAYAVDVLESTYGGGPARRLYFEAEIQAAYGTDRRNADAVVDYGTAAVVVEITARRPIRGFLHAGSPSYFVEQLEVMLDEVRQTAGTALSIHEQPRLLLGDEGRRRFYPIVVMTEGFPTNPITLSAIRAAVQEAGLFSGLDAAPVEVIDLVELEMLESLVQTGAIDIPTLLDAKTESNFHADSVRNYVTTRADLDLGISERISDLLSRPFDRVARALRLGQLDGGATDS